jgi:hypothetical protein
VSRIYRYIKEKALQFKKEELDDKGELEKLTRL